MPPGEYRLAFELAGFQNNVRDGIRVTLGFNAQVNVAPNVATLQDTVTLSGESPVIDTSATRIQTNYDQQMLSSIPNARDMWSLLSTAPSVTLNRVDVGGSTAYNDEASFFVERAVIADLGVRAGFVWKKDNDGWQQVIASRPITAPGRSSSPGASPASVN